MEKKHYICTHSWSNENARKQFIDQISNFTDKEYFEFVSTDKAELRETWMGREEFFFCHWFAESESAINEAIDAVGAGELMATLPNEVSVVLSSSNLNNQKLLNFFPQID